jgi:hypothetical protein
MKRISMGLAALGLTLAACSSDTAAPNTIAGGSSAPLTQADAQVMSDEMRGEIAGFSSGATLIDMLHLGFPVFPEAVRAFHDRRFDFGFPTNCPTATPVPPVDSDGDGVPDSLQLTFDPANCTFSRQDGQASMVLSGTITITDPPTFTSGLRVVYGTFTQKVTVDTFFFVRTVNGPWKLAANSDGFTAADSTTASRTSNDTTHKNSSLAKAWLVTFVADAPGTFSRMHHLPSGLFNIDGTTTRTRGTVTKTFSVTTVTPLHRDASCQSEDKIDSGELHVAHTTSSGTQTVDIKFTGCGQDPTVTLAT